jgi:hypothetical protein
MQAIRSCGARGSAIALALVVGSGIAVNAQQDEAPQPPAEYTRQEAVCPSGGLEVRHRGTETLEVEDGARLDRDRDGAWTWPIESASDRRMTGTVYHTYESDAYVPGPAIDVWTTRIVNDEGAWLDVGVTARSLEGTVFEETGPAVWVGEGDYEGLLAIDMESREVDTCLSEHRGLIFESAPSLEGYLPG